MTRLAETEAKIASMHELLDIVGAMRGLAGMHMQDAQRALPGIRRHAEAVAAAIADTLLFMGMEALRPEPEGQRRALVLCAAEHGFVGGFNERLVEAAQEQLAPDDELLVLGNRGAAIALEHGLQPVWSRGMATRCSVAAEVADLLSLELYRRIAAGGIARVDVLFTRYRKGGGSQIETQPLLPVPEMALERPLSSQPPLHNLDPVKLYEKLTAEYVFALLAAAAIESIASENAARFATMESAHENVSKKVEELTRDAHQARQTEITQELLELIGGANVQLDEGAA